MRSVSLADLYRRPWAIAPGFLAGIVETARGVAAGIFDAMEPKHLTYSVTAEGLGVLSLEGSLGKDRSWWGGGTSTREARTLLRQMAADEKVRAIVLRIDSPGGTVAGTPELAEDVRAVDGAKPVHAYIEDMGASAAYWVASQARSVTANATAQVGSLGTITYLVDDSKMLETMGLKVHVVSTGERKGDGYPGQPVTDAEIEDARRLVEGLNAHFVSAVRSGRGFTPKQAEALWTGQVWLAEDAKGLGLVDRVEPFDAAMERLTKPLRAAAARARLGGR